MRWAWALMGLWVAVAVQAEAPMDLDSPFLKTALIEGQERQAEERVIRKAKIAGENLEMTTESGGLALFPKAQVIGVLPRLPEGEMEYGTEDVRKAMAFLQSLPTPLQDRREASREVLERWQALLPIAAQKDAQRAERRKEQEGQENLAEVAALASWVADWSNFRKSRSAEEIQGLQVRGRALLQEVPREEKAIEEGLAFLAQWQARSGGSPVADLDKLEGIQGSMQPEDLWGWMGAGVLVASFFSLLMGLNFVSSGLTRFKDGAWLGGLVLLPMGLALLGGLGAVWLPVGGKGKEVEPGLSEGMGRLVLAAKNSVQPICFFPTFSLKAGGEEVVAGLLAAVHPAEEATGPLKARFQSATCWLGEGGWMYRQPLTVIGLPLPLGLTFSGETPSLANWRQPAMGKSWLGRVPLPKPVGELFFQSVLASWGQAAERVGLGGLQLTEAGPGEVRLVVPASGKKSSAAQVARYRKEISAEDLARAFVDGYGKEFAGKFVLLDGIVEKVESGGEFSGGTSATTGEALGQTPTKIGGATKFDYFYLRGHSLPGVRKDQLEIRCVIKSPKVFVMDSRGDVYEGPHANVTQAEPVVKKGQRVKFLKEGRVDSAAINQNLIEVYGIRLDDPSQDLQVYDANQLPGN